MKVLAAMAIALSILGTAATIDVGRASACDALTTDRYNITGVVESSPVIAIGRWTNATSFEVTFVVEESIKGTKAGERFALDNRNDSPTRGCAAVDAQQGPRFANGERSVAILESIDGEWHIANAGSAVADVSRDRRASDRYLFDGVSVREIREMAGNAGEGTNDWFVPVATVVLIGAAIALVVGGVRAGVRR